MLKLRIGALVLLIAGFFIGFFVYQTEMNPESTKKFRLGLDLSGGSYLVYKADLADVPRADVKDAMESLRDVIERRINLFGVAEPSVQVETSSLGLDEKEYHLVIELPGITDVAKATAMIGQTPLLEFKTERPEKERDAIIAAREKFKKVYEKNPQAVPTGIALEDPDYVTTPLTGRYLAKANLQFSQGVQAGGNGFGGEPIIGLTFNKEGADLFEKITGENIGKTVAIYLDGAMISNPMVQQEIAGGEAVITGQFTPEEAKQLVGRLNSGALPVPVELISTNSIGPTLGADAVRAGEHAALFGFILVALFLMIWYRLPGVLAAIALAMYAAIILALFKLIPVTLSAAGIAGFVMSLGIAVDANILIFERMKEELQTGKTLYEAMHEGFKRAWSSIRDSNISSIISGVVLFSFGSPLIKGFALTFCIGVIVSMFTAITVSRVFLYAVGGKSNHPVMRFLYSAALRSGKHTDDSIHA